MRTSSLTPDRAEFLVQCGQPFAHLDASADGPQRVVLMEQGDTEHRHHGVPDVLLDGSAVTLDRPAHRFEVARCTSRSDSGSRRSPRAVEPVTSQNTTVTVLRTSRSRGPAARGDAQAGQKAKSSGLRDRSSHRSASGRAYGGGHPHASPGASHHTRALFERRLERPQRRCALKQVAVRRPQ